MAEKKEYGQPGQRVWKEQKTIMLRFSDILGTLTKKQNIASKHAANILETAMNLLAKELDLMYALYFELLADGDTLQLVAGQDGNTFIIPKQLRISDFSALQAAHYLNGKTFVCSGSEAEVGPEIHLANGIRAGVGVPIVKNGKLVALVAVNSGFPRNWTKTEIHLLEEFAGRTWAELDNIKAGRTAGESEKHFQSIANLVPDLLWASEPDGSTSWYNQRWLEYTGQSLDQATGWGWVEAIHPDDQKSSSRRYADAVAAGKPLQQEHRIRRRDGKYRWFVVNASPLINEQGNVIKIYATATDIHDRKETENALRQSEEKYRTLFNIMNEGYCIVEVKLSKNDHVDDLVLLEVNKAWEKQTGLPKPLGQRLRNLLPDFEEKWLPYFEAVYQTGVPIRSEHYLKDIDRWFSVHYSRVSSSGSRLIAVIFDDITERKLTEQALRQNEERQTFLLKLSDALRPLTNPLSVQDTAMKLLANKLEVMYAGYFEMEKDGDSFHVAGRFEDQTMPLPERMRLSDFSMSLAAAFQSGRTIAVADTSIKSEWVKSPEVYSGIGVAAWAAVPLLKHGKLMAWIGINSGKPRAWAKIDLQILNDVAERTWDALERTRAEQALRDTELKYLLQLENDVKKRTRELQESRDSLQTIFDEQVKAEEERNKAYLLLQKSEETALLGSWEFNRLSGHLIWSDGMYRLFNLKNGTQVTPAVYLEYAIEKSLGKAKNVVQCIQESNADFEEILEMNISGKIKVLRIKGIPVRNNQGDIENVLGVDQDISAMREAEDKIKKMEQEQQLKIFRTSLSTLEEERHRISESLHNGIGQLLYGIKINMSSLRAGAPEEEFRHNKAYINELLTQAIAETRRVSHELMPTTLDQFGLKSAVDDICRQLSGKIEFNCHISVQHNRLEKYMELAVYRTTQELMTNVVKHAKASSCEVMIIVGTDQVKIVVSDNGQGMPEGAEKVNGIGLASIRSKIELLDGQLIISSNPDKGTYVEVIIPHQGLTDKPSR
ncbi:PAS domain S-box protein [Pedobacter sp. KLB.chiD]|uniref:PAS domain S-box protein n=1 Tax=Pedobacter sp. KLB.chiD TaxID=3387402 RepID=UPI00399C2456